MHTRRLTALPTPVFLLLGLTCLAIPSLAEPVAKVDVCHIPPGNPANFHTITVGEKALRAHLAHGDLLGPCGDSCETLCADGDACTQDVCDEDDRCIHPPVSCNDGNTCTADSCDAASGCVNTPLPGDVCVLDDTDPCTEPSGVCDADGACTPTPVPGCCSTTADCEAVDEDLCTIESCIDNSCQPDGVVSCSVDACNVSICEPATGICTPPVPVECTDDGDLCTAESCDVDQGGCVSTPVQCPEGQECNPADGQCEATGPICDETVPGNQCDELASQEFPISFVCGTPQHFKVACVECDPTTLFCSDGEQCVPVLDCCHRISNGECCQLGGCSGTTITNTLELCLSLPDCTTCPNAREFWAFLAAQSILDGNPNFCPFGGIVDQSVSCTAGCP